MKRVKRYMNINDIEPGMVAAEDIKSNTILLVKAGNDISNETINILKDKYIETIIAVYIEEEEKEELTINNAKTIEQVDQIFQEYTYEIKDMFRGMEFKGKAQIEDIRSFVRKIQQNFDSPSVVIKNIVLHGSGQDSVYRHSVNVAALSTILAKWIGLDANQINLINYSAILHDYGKTKIDEGILFKKDQLTEEEWKAIRKHPVIGYETVKQIPYLDSSVGYGVLMHHERSDGSGYPLGLTGDKIHMFGKIIAIADTFDAINSNRIHKGSKDPFSVLEIMKEESLFKLDYGYTKTFIEHIVNYYMGENVRLNDGRLCKILQVDVNYLTRPFVMHETEFIDLKKEKNLYVESLVF